MKDKTIRNLTKEDISIVDYKKILMKESALRLFVASRSLMCAHHAPLDRSRCTSESEAFQQGRNADEGRLILSSQHKARFVP